MIQLLATLIQNTMLESLGKYVYPAISRPAFRLEVGKPFPSPSSIEGLEVVIHSLGLVGTDGLLEGARLRYQADVYLIQHDLDKTSTEGAETLLKGLLSQRVKVIEVVPLTRNLAVDSLDQTRVRLEYYQIIRKR